MLLSLWNYLKGYVIIKITGFSVERFINLAALKGIYLWDIKAEKGGVEMKVGISGFKRLKSCAKKSGCRFRIIEKRGLPFRTAKYKKHKAYSAGVILFVAMLYAMSSFVWVVEIEGNSRISQNEIIKVCGDAGLSAGKLRSGINVKAVTNRLIDGFDDISWAAVSVKGTRAKVLLAETIVKPEIVDRTSAADVVAQSDGIIEKIVTAAGTPMVREKDVVKKGDVLVSSKIVLKSGEEELGYEFVRASAEVWAKTWCETENSISLNSRLKEFTGRVNEDIRIEIFDKTIDFFHPKIEFKSFDMTDTVVKRFKIGNYILPLCIRAKYIAERTDTGKGLTQEEAKQALEQMAYNMVTEKFIEGAQVLDVNTTFKAYGDRINAVSNITLIERIDNLKEIDITGSEDLLGTDGKID